MIDAVDAWSQYLLALRYSGRWPQINAAARGLQTAWFMTPEPVGASPDADGARDRFVGGQLVWVYLEAALAGASEAGNVGMAEAATLRLERMFGAGSAAATDVRALAKRLGALPIKSDPNARGAVNTQKTPMP